MPAWTVLQAIAVEAENSYEAEKKAFAWYQAASMEGLLGHTMCGHPINGDLVTDGSCPCHVAEKVGRTAEGTVGLIQNIDQ